MMFVLTKLKKELRITPQKLSLPLLDAITGEIQALFFDKVVKDLGLCVTLYDVRAVEGGFVFPGDGAPCFTVEFHLVMFRPFIGEVLTGKLKKCDKSGLYLSLQFFEDIYIPEHLLQQPSVFDENEKLWIWNFNGNDMFMDLDEEVQAVTPAADESVLQFASSSTSEVPNHSNRSRQKCQSICSNGNYWRHQCGWSGTCIMVVKSGVFSTQFVDVQRCCQCRPRVSSTIVKVKIGDLANHVESVIEGPEKLGKNYGLRTSEVSKREACRPMPRILDICEASSKICEVEIRVWH